MVRSIVGSLMGKLVICFFIAALVPATVVGYVSYRAAKAAINSLIPAPIGPDQKGAGDKVRVKRAPDNPVEKPQEVSDQAKARNNPKPQTKVKTSAPVEATKTMGRQILLTAACMVFLTAVAGVFVARTIALPVSTLTSHVGRASRGDLSAANPIQERNDDIGALAKSMQEMVDGTKTHIGLMLNGVNVLSSAATEISSVVADLSQSATTTATAITETSTTVEEMKQAAKLSSEKAKSVAETSNDAVQIAESGRKATEETVRRIALIKNQMESIGETVVRLSEHSQAIEEIMTTVQDLADQSNLLAVNASIEAARAGDQGKGFTVVAHEIKSLADQSKEATERVRSMLEDTRKWVSAVVMATEQGNKAVETGVEQSVLAGGSIETLTNRVALSAQAASVIEASSQQQFHAVDQASSAMVNIEQAALESSDRTRQLEDSVRQIRVLGESLKELVEKFST